MTDLSHRLLVEFLNEYQDYLKEPVADYGSNEKEGAGKVVTTLASGGLYAYRGLDLTTGVDLMEPIKGKYGTGICMDLLEHVLNPFIVAENITNSLKKNALLFVTAPFSWIPHNYPKDYWRFSEDGLKALFPKLKCLKLRMVRDKERELIKLKDMMMLLRVVGVFKNER